MSREIILEVPKDFDLKNLKEFKLRYADFVRIFGFTKNIILEVPLPVYTVRIRLNNEYYQELLNAMKSSTINMNGCETTFDGSEVVFTTTDLGIYNYFVKLREHLVAEGNFNLGELANEQ
jgi:hypothetical protein